MDAPLAGKVALVTGSSRGIGKGIALQLARSGAQVVVGHHNGADADGAAATLGEIEACGSRGWIVRGDIGVFAEVERMVESAFAQAGRVDILVNNAGIGGDYWGPVHEMPVDYWDRLLQVNLSGSFYVTRQVIRQMIAQGDTVRRIINIGSIQGLITNPWGKISSYQAAKAGLAMFTKCLAAELGSAGTTVNCIAPGAIETESNLDPARFPEAASDRERFAKRIPLGRRGDVAEVANVVAFLASEEASYVTGQVLYIDGGMASYGRIAGKPR